MEEKNKPTLRCRGRESSTVER